MLFKFMVDEGENERRERKVEIEKGRLSDEGGRESHTGKGMLQDKERGTLLR